MFNLEDQIRAWRASQAGELRVRHEVVDELESHLRDEVERLIRAGKSPEQAWDEARVRLGSPHELSREFAKVKRRIWMPALVAIVSLALFIIAVDWIIVSRLIAGKIGLLLASHIVCITIGYVTVWALGFLSLWALVVRTAGGPTDVQSAGLRTATGWLAPLAVAMTGLGIVLAALWARGHLNQWWTSTAKEFGGLLILAFGFVLWHFARSRRTTPSTLITIGAIGNIVVLLGWFGAAWLDMK